MKKSINNFSFEIHSPVAKYEFSARIKGFLNTDGIKVFIVEMPKKIIEIQRRRQLRIELNKIKKYYCTGRFFNGVSYELLMKNISMGGCAFISDDPLLIKNVMGGDLRNCKFNFNGLGNFSATIKVLNITKIDDLEEYKNGYFIISCTFKKINNIALNTLDAILMKLLIEERKTFKN